MRRLRLHRFSPTETGELLRLALGGEVEPTSAATIHGQAEGVPFIVEELAKAYREAGVIRQVDGTWTLSPQRGEARALGGPDAHRPTRGPPAGRHEGAPGRRRRARSQLQPAGPARDPRAAGREVPTSRRCRPGGAACAGDRSRAARPLPGGVARRLRVPARAGPRVRRRLAVGEPAPEDPCRHRRAARRRRRAGAGEPADARPSRPGGGRRRGERDASRSRPLARRSAATLPEEVLRSVELGLPVVSDAARPGGAAAPARRRARHAPPLERPPRGARRGLGAGRRADRPRPQPAAAAAAVGRPARLRRLRDGRGGRPRGPDAAPTAIGDRAPRAGGRASSSARPCCAARSARPIVPVPSRRSTPTAPTEAFTAALDAGAGPGRRAEHRCRQPRAGCRRDGAGARRLHRR